MFPLLVVGDKTSVDPLNEPIKVPFMDVPEFDNFHDIFDEIEDNDVASSCSEASTEDEDYVASETASENDEDYIAYVPGLETEDEKIVNEDEFLPVFDQVVKDTFDCTESLPDSTRIPGNGTMLCLGQEFADIYMLREHLRMYGILNKFELKFKKK